MNEKGRRVKGSLLRHGRAWWHLEDEKGDSKAQTHLEWNMGKEVRRAHISLIVFGEDKDVGVGLGLPKLFSVYASARVLRHEHYKRLCKRFPVLSDAIYGNGVGFDIFSLSAHFDHGFSVLARLWSHDTMDSSTDKRHWYWEPLEKILGRGKYVYEDLETVKYKLVLPDDDVELQIVFRKCQRVWERLSFPTETFVTASIDVVGGMINTDKGLRGLSCPAKSVHEAVGKFMEVVVKGDGTGLEKPKGQGVRAMGRAIRQ